MDLWKTNLFGNDKIRICHVDRKVNYLIPAGSRTPATGTGEKVSKRSRPSGAVVMQFTKSENCTLLSLQQFILIYLWSEWMYCPKRVIPRWFMYCLDYRYQIKTEKRLKTVENRIKTYSIVQWVCPTDYSFCQISAPKTRFKQWLGKHSDWQWHVQQSDVFLLAMLMMRFTETTYNQQPIWNSAQHSERSSYSAGISSFYRWNGEIKFSVFLATSGLNWSILVVDGYALSTAWYSCVRISVR